MKKLLSILLCAGMLFGAFATAVSAAQYDPAPADEHNLTVSPNIMRNEAFSLGDVNCDDAVDAKDALYMTANVKGMEGYAMDPQASDFNADGEFDAKDLYFIKLCLSGAASPEDYGDDLQVYRLTIGGKDIHNYSIVIPEDAVYDSNLYMGAEIIYEYVKDATGIALPIERGAASGDGGIYFHQVSDDSEQGLELGHEGYTYYVDNGDLHIYGTHRGNMYAAFEIVEDYLGYNFFAREGTYSEKTRWVDIPEDCDKTFVPPFRFRHSKSTFEGSSRDYFYLARGLNGAQNYNYKNEVKSIDYYGQFVGPVFINIHSYSYYWQMGTGTMPEDDGVTPLEARYYAKYESGEKHDETKWEPCATSDDDFDILFSGFLDTIRMIEARGYPIVYEDKTNCFSFSANDNSNWHTCRNCMRAADTKTYTGVYLELANRGAREIQKFYSGLDVYTWIYTREMPTNVLPDEHLIIVLAGFNCANHYLGSDDCVNGSFFNHTNKDFEDRIDQWDELCDQTGAEFWLWYYPETHYYYAFDIPNIYTIFYDFQWLYEHGLSGMFYEGSGGAGYLFEGMKSYLASQMSFNPAMSFEEYDQYVKDYCMMAYGNGWEYVYEFIQMYEDAGDAVGFEFGDEGEASYCYIGNYDRAYDFVSAAYLQENYETMRNLLLAAIEAFDDSQTTNDGLRVTRLNNLFNCFEILGLGAVYVPNYVNGNDEQRAEYTERYTEFYNYAVRTGLRISGSNTIPDKIDLSINPAISYLIAGSRRENVNTILLGIPSIGYYS